MQRILPQSIKSSVNDMKTREVLASMTLLLTCTTSCSPQGAERNQVQNPPTNMVVVISPSIPDRANCVAALTTWLMGQANCHIRIFDGWEGTQITEFTPPKVKYFRAGAVADRIGTPIHKLVAWNQESIGDASLIGTGALAIPTILERIAQRPTPPERLIFIGSPVYRSPSNPVTDFARPHLRYPSPGHLNDAHSAFSCLGRESSLAGSRVYFLFPKQHSADWPA